MITSSSKPSYQYLRKLLVLPVAAVVVALFAFKYKNKSSDEIVKAKKTITVVIDAGHGGSDPGVKSFDNKFSEAQLTLEISKSIQRLSGEYNINVIMTRENEELPGNAKNKDAGLRQRLELAHKTMPDAFVAIHMNSTSYGMQDKFSGMETYISNNTNSSEEKLLASTILQELSTVYLTDMEIKQRHTQGIYVLDHNNYPSVLVECGYMDNPADLTFISDKTNQEKVARAILKALVKYGNTPDKRLTGKINIADTGKTLVSSYSEFWSNDGRFAFRADSVVFNSDFENFYKDIKQDLFIVNNEKKNLVYFLDKIIVAKKIIVYSGNNQELIEEFGPGAKNGAIIFENATIEDLNKLNAKADTTKPVNKIFEKVEIEPTFPEGDMAWRRYLEKSLQGFNPSKNGAPKGAYTVYIQFVVDIDGSISNVIPLTKHGYGMEEKAIEAIRKGPKWVPAIQNGKNVKAYKKQPVTFEIIGKDKTNIIPYPRVKDKPNIEKEVVVVQPEVDNKEKINEVTIKDTSKAKYYGPENLLVVIDGVEQPGLKPTETLNKFDQDIISITILKDGNAIAKYGDKGKNGVIEIVTKQNKNFKTQEITLPSVKQTDNKVFEKAETEPSFPGGDEAWRRYLQKTLGSFNPADSGAIAGIYTVILQFIVDKKGNVSNIKTLTKLGHGMEEKVIEIIKKGPKWVPAIQNGHNVTAYKKQPVTFQIQEE